MDKEQHKPSDILTMRQAFGFLHFLASGHASCIAVFIRWGFGPEALGWSGIAAVLVQLIYALVAPSAAMIRFFWVWLSLVILHRIVSSWRSRRGRVEHSRYNGWPWVAMKIPFVRREMTAKSVIEPFLCFIVGVAILPFSQELGLFVMFGLVSLTLVLGIETQVRRVRARRMNDARVEQQQMAAEMQVNGWSDDY